jgi:hypothetical protein
MVGSLKMNTTLEYSTRVVQEGDRRCKKSTLNDLAYLTPLRIPLMNCMDTVNTLSVPIQYTFYPPLYSPLPFSSPSSPTHRYKVKIYRNLKGTKYSSQVQKNIDILMSGSHREFDV